MQKYKNIFSKPIPFIFFFIYKLFIGKFFPRSGEDDVKSCTHKFAERLCKFMGANMNGKRQGLFK